MEVGDEKRDNTNSRRVVPFPLPSQGHVTPMLHLGSLLHSKGFSITVIQTHFNSIDPKSFPHFTFEFIDVGLTPQSRKPNSTGLIPVLNSNCFDPFRDCLGRILNQSHPDQDLVACLIVDPMWRFTAAVAGSFNLSRIALRTGSLSAFVAHDSLPLLRAKGYFPLQEAKFDEPVLELPPLKFKDLPREPFHDILCLLVESETSQAVICNTFEEFESSAIAKVRESLPIPVFSVGRLHKFSPPAPSSSILT